MPYTPPGTSPTSCSLPSSRSPSFSSINPPPILTPGVPSGSVSAAHLPRSASFLAKHRRSPALEKPIEEAAANASHGHHAAKTSHSTETSRKPHTSVRVSGSLHQSPLPVTDDTVMPAGAIASPPESSSDEEAPIGKRRGRQLDKANLKELQDAIRKNIPQQRSLSPPKNEARFKADSPADDRSNNLLRPSGLGAHSRSSSESDLVDMSYDSEDDEDGLRLAPPMVRKKSGELVKSSLKSPRRRPNSMPSTPTFPKAVHFDQHLEHIRHFRQAEKPLAVSAGSSPVEAFENESEYPFPTEDGKGRSPPFEWEISLPNFPTDSTSRKSQNVCIERLYLSSNNENLVGTVSVRNLAFQKWVVARFTTDYWKTTSEVVAEFSSNVGRTQTTDKDRDLFTFTIKLSEVANLENKVLFLCARYNVVGQEFWDNNGAMNFQVEFKKKHIPQNGKNGRNLPRSGGRSSQLSQRPRSVPSFDDHLDAFDGKSVFDFKDMPPVSAVVGDSPERPKKSRSVRKETDPERRVNPSGQVFGNRYDFGASLNAAIAAANSTLGVRSGITPRAVRADEGSSNPYFAPQDHPTNAVNPTVAQIKTYESGKPLSNHHRSRSFPIHQAKPPSPAATPPLNENEFRMPSFEEKPSIESSSYRELLEKMCFFGSARGSPQLTQESQMPQKPTSSPQFDQHLTASPTNPQLLSVFTVGADSRSQSPSPVQRSPLMNVELSSGLSASQSSSPPSLVGSQRSSGTASPLPSYTYDTRFHDAFGLERSHTPTAIRG